MPAPPAKETPISNHSWKFRIKNGDGGSYITDADTKEKAWKELESKYGVELVDVWKG